MILNVDPELYDRVRTILPGKYTDVNQFMDVAVRNQLTLEDQQRAATPTSVAPARARWADVQVEEAGEVTLGEHAASPSVPRIDSKDSSDGGGWRSLLALSPLATEGLPQPTVLGGDDDVLWGQTNRVLPTAVGVRVLAHLVGKRPDGVPRSDWYAASLRAAQGLRGELETADRVAGRKRGELWATALPKGDPASESRYVSQFLGYLRRDGRPEGGAAFLDLVALSGADDSSLVRLTTAGAEWASLENPIFDTSSPASTFSVEEVRWFLNHLRAYRPSEHRLLAEMAALVAEGRTRTEIDVALSEAHPGWSHYIETMRAGALGRLSDLGLLRRERRGLEVDYHMTDRAHELGLPGEAVLQ